jgi:hypothetical protein
MPRGFEIKDYQGIIGNASIENELINAGYAPLDRIVVRNDKGERRTHSIKAVNKKGQKVFILIDVEGYTTARTTELTLLETQGASIIPYSLKTGALECAGKDVCGVAFECGSDAVCILSRSSQDLTPKEATFVYVEQQRPAAITLETEGGTMSYPVIRLSEIRANPNLVLSNTDAVLRRLRNASFSSEIQELAASQQSISHLNSAFFKFNEISLGAALKLRDTLQQLEGYNDVYLASPPQTDSDKDKYRVLQFNLTQRNDGIANLLRIMKKVSEKRAAIDNMAKEIDDLSEMVQREFANVESVITE